MSDRDITYVVFPQEAEQQLGLRVIGTRTYRRRGVESEFREWFTAVVENIGPVMSVGEVSLFVDVSRTAIHKRITNGTLTALVFDVQEGEGQTRRLREGSVTCIPFRECEDWARLRQESLAEEEQKERRLLEEENEALREEMARMKAERRREEDARAAWLAGEEVSPEDPAPEEWEVVDSEAENDRRLRERISRERAAAKTEKAAKKKGAKKE
jgi:hypothetical protein